MAADKKLDGKALYSAKTCNTCHGMDGIKPLAPMYPSLAGKDKACLTKQFNDIVGGKRQGGMVALMLANPMVKSVKPDELAAILDWASGLTAGKGIVEPKTTACKVAKK